MKTKEMLQLSRLLEEKEQIETQVKTSLFAKEPLQMEQENKDSHVISILEQHDKTLQSPLSRMAQWVDELAWYYHLLLLAVAITAGLILGFFLNAIAICAMSAGIFYIVTAGLLKLHQYYEKERVQSMTEMTAYAEEKFRQGIEELEDIGADLDNLASGLKEASDTIEGYAGNFAKQTKQLEEQTESTQNINQKLHQMQERLEESQDNIERAKGQIDETWDHLHSELIKNLDDLNDTEQSITQATLGIKQSATASITVQQDFADQVEALTVIVNHLEDNVGFEKSLLVQVNQSTLDLAEATKKTSHCREELKTTLDITAQHIKPSDALIEAFSEDRALAEEDRRLAEADQKRHEATRQRMKETAKAFQETFARLMSNYNKSSLTPVQARYGAT